MKVLRCRKCGSEMKESDGVRECLGCYHTEQNKRARSKFYLLHKDEILADLHTIGRQKTREKYQMPSSTLIGLLKRWGKEESKGEVVQSMDQDAPHQEDFDLPVPVTSLIPPLPPFQNSWSSEVQIKWLEVWLEVRQLDGNRS